MFLLSFTVGFMFFVFEPISLFVTNPDDIWFDLSMAMPILMGAFVWCFVALLLVLSLIKLFCDKIIKKPRIFEYILVIFATVFLITYIQGNFLSGSLPVLAGNPFSWRDYPIESVISIVLWIVAFIMIGVAIKKLSIDRVSSYVPIAVGVVFVMLSVGLISTIVTHSDGLAKQDKNVWASTYKNYNLASSKQNFYILLLDSVDSRSFDETLQNNPDYKTTFADFTYYPDSLAYFPRTRNAVPQIISGVPYRNEQSYDEYLRMAYGESTFFDMLVQDGYRLNLYESKIHFPYDLAGRFENYDTILKLSPLKLIKRIVRFDLYKYLPYPLKSIAKIELLGFDPNLIVDASGNGYALHDWIDKKNYDIYNNQELEITDDKIFSFIHLEGSHDPYDIDGDMQDIEGRNGTYTQKHGATFATIKAFLDRLKREGVYDDSVIIVMADHGHDTTTEYATKNFDAMKQMNPILYIKGNGETHSEMIRSDKPISYDDLNGAYSQLLNGQPSTELFKGIEYPRTRKYLWYDQWESLEMVEYETDGAAWEVDKMVPTGMVYRLGEQK